MTRLTKTGLELLQEAGCKSHGTVAVHFGHITSRRKGQYGYRRIDAANKLVEQGLLKRLSSNRTTYHLCHGFGADHGVEVVFEITDNGRKALE